LAEVYPELLQQRREEQAQPDQHPRASRGPADARRNISALMRMSAGAI
jgi:hypothetical protein